jgi:capsular polysaccharide biosynthesis protein
VTLKRLYVSRVGSSRQLRNEEALEEFLKTHDFQILRTGDLGNVMSNARLFDEAKLVIGPHGAGLANVAFCSPDTVVLEIASNNFWLPLFSALAQAAKLSHMLLLLETKNADDPGDALDAVSAIRAFLDNC